MPKPHSDFTHSRNQLDKRHSQTKDLNAGGAWSLKCILVFTCPSTLGFKQNVRVLKMFWIDIELEIAFYYHLLLKRRNIFCCKIQKNVGHFGPRKHLCQLNSNKFPGIPWPWKWPENAPKATNQPSVEDRWKFTDTFCPHLQRRGRGEAPRPKTGGRPQQRWRTRGQWWFGPRRSPSEPNWAIRWHFMINTPIWGRIRWKQNACNSKNRCHTKLPIPCIERDWGGGEPKQNRSKTKTNEQSVRLHIQILVWFICKTKEWMWQK